MSLSGSTAENNSRTNDGMLRFNELQGPEPTLENPGGVHPDVYGLPARPGSMPGSGAPDHGGDVRGAFGNYYMFQATFARLSSAFTDAIHSIQDEGVDDQGTSAKALINRLKEIQSEIDGWRAGKGLAEVEKAGGERNESANGGMFTD